MIVTLSVVVNNFKRALNLVKTQMGGQVPPLPPPPQATPLVGGANFIKLSLTHTLTNLKF